MVNHRWTGIPVNRLLLVAAGALTTVWLWHCWCVFPWLSWNELRLQPSFLIQQGFQIYPGRSEGPITTWIYGPITPFLFLPATLASNAAGALMVGAAINLTIVLAPILLVAGFWPLGPGRAVTFQDRALAGMLCIVLWPASSFQHIQADNSAIALSLLGNLLLVRSRHDARWSRWLAVGAAIAAIGCKQTAVAGLVAQIVWLGCSEGRRSAVQHAIRGALCGTMLALASIAYFGPGNLWLNLVHVPGQLPWTSDPVGRMVELTPFLATHIVAPILVIVLARRFIWCKTSTLLLPALSFLAALPLELASLFKIGGNINSLHGLHFFLPPALVALTVFLRIHPRWWTTLAAATAALLLLRFQSVTLAWTPKTAHLHEAEIIVHQLPQRIWFPWNPLVTYYQERRFDHVEDGLYVRTLIGQRMTRSEAFAHLPPEWHGTATIRGSGDWGIASQMHPSETTVTEVGLWTLTTWK